MWKYQVDGNTTYLLSPDNLFSVEFITSDSLLYALELANKVFKEDKTLKKTYSTNWSFNYKAYTPGVDKNLQVYSSLVNQCSHNEDIVDAYVGYLIHSTSNPRKTLGGYYNIVGNLLTGDFEYSNNLNYTFHCLKQSYGITTLRQAMSTPLQAPELYITNDSYPDPVWFSDSDPAVLDLPAIAVCQYFEDFTTIDTPESIMSHFITNTQGTAK